MSKDLSACRLACRSLKISCASVYGWQGPSGPYSSSQHSCNSTDSIDDWVVRCRCGDAGGDAGRGGFVMK